MPLLAAQIRMAECCRVACQIAKNPEVACDTASGRSAPHQTHGASASAASTTTLLVAAHKASPKLNASNENWIMSLPWEATTLAEVAQARKLPRGPCRAGAGSPCSRLNGCRVAAAPPRFGGDLCQHQQAPADLVQSNPLGSVGRAVGCAVLWAISVAVAAASRCVHAVSPSQPLSREIWAPALQRPGCRLGNQNAAYPDRGRQPLFAGRSTDDRAANMPRPCVGLDLRRDSCPNASRLTTEGNAGDC